MNNEKPSENKVVNKKDEVDDGTKVQLIPNFIAGLAEKIRDSVFFQDDNTVVYPVGHNVCVYDIEERKQKLISGLDGTERICALAVSRSKRYLAVAEQTDKTPIISVYDLFAIKKSLPGVPIKPKKQFASTEIKNSAIVSM